MIPHVDARSNKNAIYPRRASVDDESVRWSEESAGYAPDSWDAPVLAKFARPAGVYGEAQYWADPPLDAGVTAFHIWQPTQHRPKTAKNACFSLITPPEKHRPPCFFVCMEPSTQDTPTLKRRARSYRQFLSSY